MAGIPLNDLPRRARKSSSSNFLRQGILVPVDGVLNIPEGGGAADWDGSITFPGVG